MDQTVTLARVSVRSLHRLRQNSAKEFQLQVLERLCENELPPISAHIGGLFEGLLPQARSQ